MNNVGLFFKSHKGLALIILVYLVFCFYFTAKISHFILNSKYSSTAENLSDLSDIVLLENESYSFDITVKNSNWSGITVFFDKIEEDLPISISMQISDESGRTVFSYSPDAKALSEANGYFRFNFANALKAQNGRYTVKVFGTNINLKVNPDTQVPAYKLYGNLLGKLLIPFVIIFWIALLFAGFIVIYIVYIKQLKPEQLFLIGAVIFGLFFMLVMPPLTVGDECRHYDTAYDLSNKFLGIKNTVPNQMMKRTADLSLVPSDYMQNQNWTLFNYYEEIWPHVFSQLKKPQDYSLISVYPYATKLNTYFFMFLPSAIGITLGRLLKLNFLLTFWLGRFFNLGIFILLGYYALKKYSYGKTFYATFALAPMFLHQIASYSYDSPLMSLILYFVIAVSAIITEKRKISRKECVCLCLTIFLFASCKVVYFLIVFILLFLKKNNFSSLKAKRLFLFFALVCLVSSFVFNRLYDKYTIPLFNIEQSIAASNEIPKAGSVSLDSVNAATEMTSVKWVLKNPLTYAYILLNTLAERGNYYLITAAGGYLGWEAIPMNKLLVAVVIGLFIFQLFRTKHEDNYDMNERPVGQRIVIAFIFIFISGAIFTSLNLIAPPDFYNPVIGSVQGRYFLPALPLLYLCRSNTAEPASSISMNVFCIQFFVLIMFAIDLAYRIVGIY